MKKVFFKRKAAPHRRATPHKYRKAGIRIAGKTTIHSKEVQSMYTSDGETVLAVLFPFVFALLILIGSLLNFCWIFEVKWQKQWVFSLTIIVAASVLLIRLSQKNRLVMLVGSGILALIGVMSGTFLRDIYAKLGNIIIREWNRYYGIRLGLFTEVPVTDIGFGILYVMMWVSLVLVYQLMRQKRQWLLILISASTVAMGLLVGSGPSKVALVCLLGGMISAISYQEQKKIAVSRIHQKNRMIRALVALAVVMGAVLLSQMMPKKWENAWLEQHDEMLAYQQNLEQRIMSMDFPGLDLFGIGWQENGYVTNKNVKYTEQEIFTVRVSEEPIEKMYFRGFVGTYYKNGRWYQTDEEAFAKEAATWDSKSTDIGMDLWNQSVQSAQVYIGGLYAPGLLMEYTSQCGSYAYLPYYFKLDSAQGLLSTLADTEIYKPVDMEKYSLDKQAIYENAVIGSGSWVELEDALLNGDYLVSTSLDLQPIVSNEVWAKYQNYVKDTYTKTTSNGIERLTKLANELKEEGYGVQAGDINYSITINKVLEELHSQTNYNRELNKLPKGTDVVENFLFDSRQGYCIHYASAATILLQKLGVPARYVTGYAVGPEEFVQTSEEMYSAIVPDSDGHAWVEVFDPGVNAWIPVEATKSVVGTRVGIGDSEQYWSKMSRALSPEPEQQTETEQPETPQSQTEQKTETEQKPEDTSDANGGGNRSGNAELDAAYQLKSWQVSIFIVVCLLFVVNIGRRFYHYQRKLMLKRKLNNRNTKMVMITSSHAIYKKLLQSGMLKDKNLPDEVYTIKAANKMDFLDDHEFEKFMECVKRCAYTDYVPTAKEAAWARSIYERLCISINNRNI